MGIWFVMMWSKQNTTFSRYNYLAFLQKWSCLVFCTCMYVCFDLFFHSLFSRKVTEPSNLHLCLSSCFSSEASGLQEYHKMLVTGFNTRRLTLCHCIRSREFRGSTFSDVHFIWGMFVPIFLALSPQILPFSPIFPFWFNTVSSTIIRKTSYRKTFQQGHGEKLPTTLSSFSNLLSLNAL